MKNIPKHLTGRRFKAHFSKVGEVTDAKIMRTRDKKSRLFGFIGYYDPKDAQKAIKEFNDTYIDTSKISVELAKAVKK